MQTPLLAVLLIATNAYGANRAIDNPQVPDAERIARSRHVILTPAHPLSDTERAALLERGVEVKSAVGGGRLLLRVPPGVSVDATLGSVEPLTAQKKIDRSAIREVARGNAFARVTVTFYDDVPFEAARDVIIAAGGAIDDPLQLTYDFPSRIRARIPSTALTPLAADQRVLLVHGRMTLKPISDNAISAQVSKVNVVQAAPYNLTGAGVVMSYFELGLADASHSEFEGRLITHMTGGSAVENSHATHTAGTMIAAGIDPVAKGMAPKATLHEFGAAGDLAPLLTRKKDLTTYGSLVDNNSWHYTIGWCPPGKCVSTWEWAGYAELYGAYDSLYTAGFDKVAKDSPVLMIYSSGNEADLTGPVDAPFSHKHDDVPPDPNTYCYSVDGSGNDCPLPCSVGAKYCEKLRHPRVADHVDPPWTSVGIAASAKNVLVVGAVNTQKVIGSFSSRGPMLDGRIKPEIVARGINVWSTNSGGGYTVKDGTSMSAPAVAGIAALLIEQWRKTFAGANPTPIGLKTLLIAGAEDLGKPGADYEYGFGLADAKASADLILADNAEGRRIQTGTAVQGAQIEYSLTNTSTQKLRVVLGWVDPDVLIFGDDDLATSALVNDLDLKVIDPAGNTVLPYVLDKNNPATPATRGVNTIDNVEEVEIDNAVPGLYRVVVSGSRITAASPQAFALVANAALPAACRDETNNSESTAYSLSRNESSSGKLCDTADGDYFRFLANKAGTVSVAVTATDTPLRVTLSSSATAPVTITVPAGSTQTASVQYNGSDFVTFIVKVESAGTVGLGTYTLTPSYPFQSVPRRRAIRGR